MSRPRRKEATRQATVLLASDPTPSGVSNHPFDYAE